MSNCILGSGAVIPSGKMLCPILVVLLFCSSAPSFPASPLPTLRHPTQMGTVQLGKMDETRVHNDAAGDHLLSAMGPTDVYAHVATKHRTSNCVCVVRLELRMGTIK